MTTTMHPPPSTCRKDHAVRSMRYKTTEPKTKALAGTNAATALTMVSFIASYPHPRGFRSGVEPSRDCYQQTSSHAERMFTATPKVVLVGWFDVPAESALSRAPEHEIRDSFNAD